MPTLLRCGRCLLAFVVALGVCLPRDAAGTTDAAMLHARLEASTPAADDTLHAPLDSVRLEFSAAVSADLTRLFVLAPQGDTITLQPGAYAGDRRVIAAALPSLRAGAHVLHWRTTSADGHVLEGTIPFVVAPGAAASESEPELEPAASTAGPAPSTGDAVGERQVDAAGGAAASAAQTPMLLPLVRALGTGLLLALAGGLLFARRSEAAAAALLPLLRLIAIAAPLAGAAELYAWTVHVAGSFDAGAALQLATGRALLARIVFALVAAIVLLLLRSVGLAAVIALVAVLAGGSLGHAGAITPVLSIPLRAVHMAAAAVWLGGLVALVLALRNAPAQRTLLQAVSSAALASFVVVAITGAAQALLLLGSLDALFQTTYGRFVLVKATGLLLLAAFGFLHRRMIALVPDGAGAATLRRSVVAETLVFIGLILVSGALAFAQLPE